MTRGLYISLAVLGLLLIVAAGVSAVAAIAPPGGTGPRPAWRSGPPWSACA